MKVCIVGAGVVGSYLTRKLSREGYEIAVVDVDSSKLEHLSYSYDILAVNCNALEINCLKKVSNFDLFVIVTESEEKNLTIATLLKALLKKEKVIVRVQNKALSSPPVKEFLGLETVNILVETVSTVISQVKYPFAQEVIRIENEGLLIIKYRVTVEDPFAGKQVKELYPVREIVDFTIVAVEREDRVIIPKGEAFIYPGDVIYVAVKEKDVQLLVEAFEIKYRPVTSVVVLGFSRFTEELLARLSDFKDLKVKFVDSVKDNCEKVAGEFPGIEVFHGELTDVELLKSEGIEKTDLVVALSEDEELNVLTGILSKKLGAGKASALITHPEYEKIVPSVGIDVPLVPRKLLASKVYRQLSRRKYLEIVELSEEIDVVETEVPESRAGKKIKEVGNELCGLVVAIKRKDGVEIAKGETRLEKGDKLICITRRQ